MVKLCRICHDNNPNILRPKTLQPYCKPCFIQAFENQIHQTIIQQSLFKQGQAVAIGVSGGKDSTVIAHVLNKLNQQKHYGLKLFLLSIDQGITGYRDDSLQCVKVNQHIQNLPLLILSYKDLYGWTMDQIVSKIGRNNNCTYCGIFRRQALQRGAIKLKADKIVTGHNADDIAQTVLLNFLRGDIIRLRSCVASKSQFQGNEQIDSIPRIKPFKYSYQKEIVMYAHFRKLVYFSTQCVYSPFAYRGHVRELIKELELVRPSCIIDLIRSAQKIQVDYNQKSKIPVKSKCERCGFMTSAKICKACVLLEGLNKGKIVIKKQKNN